MAMLCVGSDAQRALQQHIGSRKIACDVQNTDQYGRKVSICYGTKGEDLNEWMVANGEAVAYREYSKAYTRAEDAARKAKKVQNLNGTIDLCIDRGVVMPLAVAISCQHTAFKAEGALDQHQHL